MNVKEDIRISIVEVRLSLGFRSCLELGLGIILDLGVSMTDHR